jgi:hypothetical protein
MTIAEAYLGGSQVFRRLKNGPHEQLIERYAARLVEDGLARHGTWRCLNVVGGLLNWMASHRIKVTNLSELWSSAISGTGATSRRSRREIARR